MRFTAFTKVLLSSFTTRAAQKINPVYHRQRGTAAYLPGHLITHAWRDSAGVSWKQMNKSRALDVGLLFAGYVRKLDDLYDSPPDVKRAREIAEEHYQKVLRAVEQLPAREKRDDVRKTIEDCNRTLTSHGWKKPSSPVETTAYREKTSAEYVRAIVRTWNIIHDIPRERATSSEKAFANWAHTVQLIDDLHDVNEDIGKNSNLVIAIAKESGEYEVLKKLAARESASFRTVAKAAPKTFAKVKQLFDEHVKQIARENATSAGSNLAIGARLSWLLAPYAGKWVFAKRGTSPAGAALKKIGRIKERLTTGKTLEGQASQAAVVVGLAEALENKYIGEGADKLAHAAAMWFGSHAGAGILVSARRLLRRRGVTRILGRKLAGSLTRQDVEIACGATGALGLLREIYEVIAQGEAFETTDLVFDGVGLAPARKNLLRMLKRIPEGRIGGMFFEAARAGKEFASANDLREPANQRRLKQILGEKLRAASADQIALLRTREEKRNFDGFVQAFSERIAAHLQNKAEARALDEMQKSYAGILHKERGRLAKNELRSKFNQYRASL